MKVNQGLVGGCVCALLLGVSSAAYADAGDGIEGENLRLRLGLGASGQANTNLFYQPEVTDNLAWSLNISPSLSLESINSQVIDFNLNWDGNWQQFLSSNELVRDQSGFSTTLGANANINAQGAVSLRLEESLNRTNEAPNNPSRATINRFINRAGAVLGIHPGGRAIQTYLSYHWKTTNFNFQDSSLNDLDSDQHQLRARAVWQFLPRTAALLTAQFAFVNYDQPTRRLGSDLTIPNFNSRPLRVTAGLNGLILNRVSAQANIGYGNSFYVNGPNFGGVIGDLKLTYYLGGQKDSSVSLGYERSFQDSTLGNFFASHIVRAIYNQNLFEDKLALRLSGGPEFRTYALVDASGNLPLQNGGSGELPDDIQDALWTADANVNWNPTKWATIGAGYGLRLNDTEDNIIQLSGPADLQGRNYVQQIFSLSAQVRY